MKYSLFFSLSVLFHAYFLVQCEFIRKSSHSLPGPEKPSLVLAIDYKFKHISVANFTIDVTEQEPDIGEFLFVCPAENDAERELLKKRRFSTKNTPNILFVRDTFRYEDPKLDQNPTEERQLDEDKSESDSKDFKNKYLEYDCKDLIIEPSVIEYKVHRKTYSLYYVGFEVFFDEDKYTKLNTINSPPVEDSPKVKWFNLMSIQFDKKNGNVLNVSNDSNQLLASRSQRENLEEYSPVDPKINTAINKVFYEEFDVSALYSLDNQRDVFINKLFKDRASSNTYKYINETEHRYLVENHLSPLRDFATPLLQKAANHYGNIAPMWKIIKENSWSKVETEVEHLVRDYGEQIIVITGTYGTLKLEDKEIYLGSEKNIRVPLAFWKIVGLEEKKSKSVYFDKILIVTLNNPYEDVRLPIHLCPDSQCTKYGWDKVVQDSYSLGRTLCCKVTEENAALLEVQNLRLFLYGGRILNLRDLRKNKAN